MRAWTRLWIPGEYAEEVLSDLATTLERLPMRRGRGLRAFAMCARELLHPRFYQLALRLRRTPAGARSGPGGGQVARLIEDLALGGRTLRRSPGYAAVAVLTIGLAVGVNASLFSTVRAVLFEPLPYDDPSALATIWSSRTATGGRLVEISHPDFVDLKARARSFVDIAAIGPTIESNLHIEGAEGTAEQVRVTRVSANLFDLLGVEPAIGRGFLADGPEGEAAGPGAHLVLSAEFWRRQLGADPSVVGRSLNLDGQPVAVLGVLEPGFTILQSPEDRGAFGGGSFRAPDAWIVGVTDRPASAPAHMRVLPQLRIFARLAPSASMESARREVKSIARELRDEVPEHANAASDFELIAMRADIVAGVRPLLLILWGMVAAVLLIACTNVATLSLVRASRRSKNLALHAVLGGSRARLMRQLLAEAGWISVMGAGVGVVIALWATEVSGSMAAAVLPRFEPATLDRPMLGFLIGVATLTTLVVGLVPSGVSLRRDLGRSLGEGRGSAPRRGHHTREALVAGQVAGSAVLVVGAGLMLRSLVELESVDLGFSAEPDELVSFRLVMPQAGYRRAPERLQFIAELTAGLESLPGVRRAVATWPLPMGGDGMVVGFGSTLDEIGRNPAAVYRAVTPGYFATLGATLVDGRGFEWDDWQRRPVPVVLDEATAELAFPGRTAVGRTMLVERGSDSRLEVQVIGLVRHFVESDITRRETRPKIWTPYGAMTAQRNTWFMAHLEGPAAQGLAEAFRRQVGAIDPGIGLSELKTLETYRDEHLVQPRLAAGGMAALGVLALALAMFGLYAVVSAGVQAQRREIGVRMALGAPRGRVGLGVLASGLRVTGIGLAVGVLLAGAGGRLIASQLYGIEAWDVATFGGVTALLLAVALVATWAPTHRALSVDPATPLRDSA